MELTEPQRRFLRGRAHHLRPCIHVGSGGVTAAVLTELGQALNHHELLKVRIRAADREARDAAVAALVAGSGALLVSRIGHVAVLYRPDAEGPRLTLPAAAAAGGARRTEP